MAIMWLEALGRRNVAGPLLLLNLVLYVFMMGFASWALNSFVDGHHRQQYYYPPAPAGPRSAGEEATLQFIQSALLAAVVGAAAKAATAFHARAWRPQGLAAAAALGTVAWAATALAFGLACKEMRAGAGAARGWRMRALEGLTTVLALTQLLYVAMLHAAVAGDRCQPGCLAEDDQEHRRGGPTCSVM
ncbi:membrane protein PM19L-like [Panicum virgatum]|uniref:membrane protein PM19L-like n=1 Tax=Panicum virgatum TaxID=38727 RepID=UPI0019D6A34F|nr:membrane protein PM19L-like [Panicum virgatum]